MAKLKAGILISGRGSNMAALIAATRTEDFPAEIALVVSNRADAGGLALAREAGVPTAVTSHRDYPDRESFDRAVSAELEGAGVDIVCLAGFMRLLTAEFVAAWHVKPISQYDCQFRYIHCSGCFTVDDGIDDRVQWF